MRIPSRLPLLATAWLLAAPALAERPASMDAQLRRALERAVAAGDSFPDRFAAEVWLLDMSRRLRHEVPDPAFRIELLKQVHYEAYRAALPAELVLAVIEVESNFDPYAISSAGARGLMQVMPFWLEEIGRPGDSLFRVRTNLRYGCTILKYYLEKENGNLFRALARYNGSLGQRWYPARVERAWRTRWFPQ